jgi:flavodoxin
MDDTIIIDIWAWWARKHPQDWKPYSDETYKRLRPVEYSVFNSMQHQCWIAHINRVSRRLVEEY